MLTEDIFKLTKAEFEELDLELLGLDLIEDVQKILVLSQWHSTYHRKTTSQAMRLAILQNTKRLLNE